MMCSTFRLRAIERPLSAAASLVEWRCAARLLSAILFCQPPPGCGPVITAAFVFLVVGIVASCSYRTCRPAAYPLLPGLEHVCDPRRPWPERAAWMHKFREWSGSGSNRRPSGCKPDALPTELPPRAAWLSREADPLPFELTRARGSFYDTTSTPRRPASTWSWSHP